METNTKLKSEENLERLKTLTEKVGFDSIRLMVDPQKASSPEAVIEDVCLYLEEEVNGNKNSKLVLTFGM